MAIYTKRVQAVLTEEQYRALVRIAREQHSPVSHLVRQAIEAVYLGGGALEERREALGDLLAADAPIADWETMEAEIMRGALED